MRIEAAKKIFKLFKENENVFYKFFSLEREKDKESYYQNFIKYYDDILISHTQRSEIKGYGTPSITASIGRFIYIPTASPRGERSWFVNHGFFKAEEITFWSSLGINGEDKMRKWQESKPTINDKLDSYLQESIENGEIGYHELYAERYNKWSNNKPEYEWIIINDLTNEHILSILKGGFADDEQRQLMENVLKDRKTTLKEIEAKMKADEEKKKNSKSNDLYYSLIDKLKINEPVWQ